MALCTNLFAKHGDSCIGNHHLFVEGFRAPITRTIRGGLAVIQPTKAAITIPKSRRPLVLFSSNDNDEEPTSSESGEGETVPLSEEPATDASSDESSSNTEPTAVDVVPSNLGFESNSAATSKEPKEEINPLVAAGIVAAGLVFSFLLLYYELKQAQLLD